MATEKKVFTDEEEFNYAIEEKRNELWDACFCDLECEKDCECKHCIDNKDAEIYTDSQKFANITTHTYHCNHCNARKCFYEEEYQTIDNKKKIRTFVILKNEKQEFKFELE